jgi:F0F1-type ATP synthase membrane subunit a
VRLAANIVAGHLLLTLLSSQACNLRLIVLLFLMSGLIILILLEAAVALIQAYVFSVLSTLYLNEVTSFKIS